MNEELNRAGTEKDAQAPPTIPGRDESYPGTVRRIGCLSFVDAFLANPDRSTAIHLTHPKTEVPSRIRCIHDGSSIRRPRGLVLQSWLGRKADEFRKSLRRRRFSAADQPSEPQRSQDTGCRESGCHDPPRATWPRSISLRRG